MDEKLLIGIGSLLFGMIGTYLAAILKHRKDLEFKYDTDLREKRITQYVELWKVLQDLSMYAREKKLNSEDLRDLTVALRQWYYEKGGLFLSDSSRDAYEALQKAIEKLLKDAVQSPGDDYETLRQKGSELRTALTLDVGTRKKPRLN